MKWENSFRKVLKALSNFITFFLLVAFVTTCCMNLFITTLSQTLELDLNEKNLEEAAKLTFGNVVLLSFLFTVIDAFRRRFTVSLPAQRIISAGERIAQGDYSVRIRPQRGLVDNGAFSSISECINKMASELGGVESLRSDFIANVSHEMKTPLSVLQNYGRLLQDPELDSEKRAEYAKAVADTSRRMSDMVTNILKLNRLENQQIYPKRTQFDLGEQLCECLLQYESIWESSEIVLETDISEEIRITADEELLSLVWNNLFSNAFKFTPSGGKVTVSLTVDDEYAYVKVEDTGCGMTAEVGAHIFEKFYQGDTSHSGQGNGLGLALVKRVVDILHGEISVESSVGVGTAFTVKLKRDR